MAIAHLHVHSWYSFGRGTASPEALCSAAARQGVEAVALTDLDGLYGIPEFLEAADRHGIHPVVGAALPDPRLERSHSAGRAVLLARDGEGYAELCHLLTRRRAEPLRPLNSLLERVSNHLWILSPDLALLRAVQRVRGSEFLLAELRAGTRWSRLAEEAEALGIASVGTAAIQLADASDRRFQKLLRAAHGQLPFGRIGPAELASERGWMLDEGATRAAFSRWPEAPARALDVARDCRVTDLSDLVGADRSDAAREAAARLRARVEDAAARLSLPPAGLRVRLERELAVLCRGARPMAMELVADLATHAHERGLAASATPLASGSVVAWLLGLLPCEPLAAELPFAPLCNESADGALRLDLQVAAEGRSQLIQRLREQVGAHRVVTAGRFLRWDLRGATRDVARSAGLRGTECERVLGLLPPDWRGEGPDELLARCPRLRGSGIDQAPWDKVLRAATRLAGVPRGLEAGDEVVIAAGPIADRVPTEPRGGTLVAQWDPALAGAVGMLSLALPPDPGATLLLRARGDEPYEAAVPALAPLLPLLASGATLGCPGLEELAVRRALRRTPPDTLDALVTTTAFVPRGAFAEDLAGEAGRRAGLGDDEADLLARALRDDGDRVERARLRQLFVEGLRAGGDTVLGAAQRWDRLVAELPGAPCRADRITGVVAGLRALDLRRRRPAPFLAALLGTGASVWPRHVIAGEARRAGVDLRPPCVQVGPVETEARGDAIHVGLAQVRGVRPELCLSIVAERRDRGLFTDLADFVERVPGTVDEVDSLIAAGAFDAIEPERGRGNLRLLHRHLRPFRQRPRSGTRRRARPKPPPQAEPHWAELDAPRRASRLRGELESLGFTVSGHALEIVGAECPAGTMDVADLDQHIDAPVVVAGWMAGGKLGGRTPPPDLRWWAVLDGGAALFDVAVPDRLARLGGQADTLRPKGPWLVEGRVQARGGFVWVEASALHRLGERAGIASLAESA